MVFVTEPQAKYLKIILPASRSIFETPTPYEELRYEKITNVRIGSNSCYTTALAVISLPYKYKQSNHCITEPHRWCIEIVCLLHKEALNVLHHRIISHQALKSRI